MDFNKPLKINDEESLFMMVACNKKIGYSSDGVADFYHCFLSSVLLSELHTEGNLDVAILAVTVTLKHISQAHCVACLNKSVIG